MPVTIINLADDKEEVKFEDIEIGGAYYDSNDTLCIKISAKKVYVPVHSGVHEGDIEKNVTVAYVKILHSNNNGDLK